MKQQNFVTAAMQQPVQLSNTVQSKRTHNLFSAISDLYTRYTEWTARRDRVKICKQVAQAFRTDMNTAGTLLYLFRDMTLWIDGDPNEERAKLFAFLAGEIEQPQIEQHEPPVHPAWTKEQLSQRAPMIEDYDEFDPELHAVAKLAQTLNMAQLERPKAKQPAKQPAKDSKDKDLELAIDSLVDFTNAIFEDNLIDNEGVLLKGNVAPWAKRGDLPTPAKERAKMVIDRTEPPVWFINSSKLWQFNLVEYDDAEDAIEELTKAYIFLSEKE